MSLRICRSAGAFGVLLCWVRDVSFTYMSLRWSLWCFVVLGLRMCLLRMCLYAYVAPLELLLFCCVRLRIFFYVYVAPKEPLVFCCAGVTNVSLRMCFYVCVAPMELLVFCCTAVMGYDAPQ